MCKYTLTPLTRLCYYKYAVIYSFFYIYTFSAFIFNTVVLTERETLAIMYLNDSVRRERTRKHAD